MSFLSRWSRNTNCRRRRLVSLIGRESLESRNLLTGAADVDQSSSEIEAAEAVFAAALMAENVQVDADDDPHPGDQADDGIADDFLVTRSDDGTRLEIYVNGRLAFSAKTENVGEIQILGSGDDDSLTIDHSQKHGTVNGFVDYHITFVGTDQVSASGDRLRIVGDPGFVVARETYLVGNTEDAGTWILDPNDSTGSAKLGEFDGDEMVVNFSGLEPVDTDTPSGIFDVLLTPGADSLKVQNAADLNGVSALEVFDLAGTFETFRFANKDRVELHGLNGSDSFFVDASQGAEGLAHLQLLGDHSTGLVSDDDDSLDSFVIDATHASFVTVVAGGGGNDAIDLGLTDNTLSNLLGTVSISGGQDLETPVFSSTINVGTESKSISNRIGDVMRLHDSMTPSSINYAVYPESVERDAIGGIYFTNIETLDLETSLAASNVQVVNTANASRLFVTTQGDDDTIAIKGTGEFSLVSISSSEGTDEILVENSGDDSILEINSGPANDRVSIFDTGTESGLNVFTGEGHDEIRFTNTGTNSLSNADTGEDEDLLVVDGTGQGSRSRLGSGTANDVFEIGLSSQSLQEVQGTLMIDGMAGELYPVVNERVTAGRHSIELAVSVGDALNVYDTAFPTSTTYLLTAGSVERGGIVPIDYINIESLTLKAGTAENTVEVVDIPKRTNVLIETQSAADIINIQQTGKNSFLELRTDAGADAINLMSTGYGSISLLETQDGSDLISVETTGDSSGVAINGGIAGDMIQLNGTGENSRVRLSGGTGNDDFRLGPDASVLDLLRGAIEIDGQGEDQLPGDTETVSWMDESVTVTNPVGDILQFFDSSSMNPNSYALSNVAFSRNGVADTSFVSIESVHLFTGQAVNQIEIASTPANSVVEIQGGSAADEIAIGQTGRSSLLRIQSNDGDDNIHVTDTGLESVTKIETGAGSDRLIIDSTGDSSGLQLLSGQALDTVQLRNAGSDSVLNLDDGAGPDLSERLAIARRDVNGDGFVTARDVLIVVQTINKKDEEFYGPDGQVTENSIHIDINRNGYISASDVLLIVQHINANTRRTAALAQQAQPEGELDFASHDLLFDSSQAQSDGLFDGFIYDPDDTRINGA